MTSTRKVRALGLLLGAATFAASHSSLAEMTYFVNQAGGVDVANREIDFSTASVPIDSGGTTDGLKTWVLNLSTNSNKSQCFQIWTAGDGTGDTRFWAGDPTTGDLRSLNDDSNGTLYSTANVWVVPNLNTYEYADLVVTSYSPFYNSMKFELIVHRLPTTTTEAQCTQGATLKKVRGAVTFVNAS
jgi:hypothetical protein